MSSRVLVLVLRVLALLPLPMGRRLGRCLGALSWLFHTRMVATTRTNLALCYPTLSLPEREQLGRDSISHTWQTIAEAGPIWLWPAADTLALIRKVEGLPLLQQAHAAGKGVIVLGPHLGNWELVGLYLNGCGCGQNSQLYQAPSDPRLAALIYAARSRAGANMVATDSKGIGQLLQALRRGEVIGVLPDQVPPASGGEFVPFFGHPALTMTLVTRLQQKTGARILLAWARRTTGTNPGFEMLIRAPDDEIYAEHIPTALAAMNRSIEALVAECPAQYQWEYKRFKRQPAGMPRIYP